MELFIRLVNGQPFEHPIFGDNFRRAFPNVDTNNLPAEYARFIRAPAPVLGPYEKNQTVSYQLVDGAYTDVFTCEQMTAEEIAVKQQSVKDAWAALPNRDNFAAWTFDEVSCDYQPPTPRPVEGNYFWQGTTNSWQLG